MTHRTDPEKEKSLMSASHTGLLLLAKEGDGDAFARLAEEYKPMLDSSVAPYRADLSDQDMEDLQQEALLAFHRAVQSYELLYGNVSFGLYAKICVGKAIVSALRQLKKNAGVVVISLDEIEPSEFISGDPADSVIERENAAELRSFIRENLSKYENSVWWMHYSGMSIDEIAESLGSTKKSVSNALARIKRKLRSLLS
ncbi:MAG: sigma-70 family RNA polymerase sigma factor [Clostridia bacterium]|nr:sigma-70 family RNA polymerase sigma factor [Clostridia bacterium]